MTIHHDKLAYGRLSSVCDEFSEDRLAAMAGKLSDVCAGARPDYKNSVAGLACSVLRRFGIEPPQGEYTLPLADSFLSSCPKNAAVLVLDGMGANVMRSCLADDGFFRSNLAGEYSSVFPSATAAAATSLQSGLAPCRHGWIGWTGYFPEEDKNVVLFTNEDADRGGQASRKHLARERFPFSSVPDMIRASGNEVHSVSAFLPPNPANFKELCSIMRDIINKKREKPVYVYAYWHEPDKTMHRCGAASAEAARVLKEIEEETEKLFAGLQEDTLLFVTADHGHIDAERNVWIGDYPDIVQCLRRPPSCEPRALNFFVKDGMHGAFRSAFARHFADSFSLYSKADILSGGLLGEGAPRPGLADVIGDYFAAAEGGVSVFNAKEDARKIKGVHGGLTQDELSVPLIVLRR